MMQSISAPEVIASPISLTVTQNQTPSFHCSADGNPKPSVCSWSKTSGTGQGNKSVQDSKQQIRSASYKDSGSNVCTTTNGEGEKVKWRNSSLTTMQILHVLHIRTILIFNEHKLSQRGQMMTSKYMHTRDGEYDIDMFAYTFVTGSMAARQTVLQLPC